MAARIAAPAPTMIVPRLVEKSSWANSTACSSLVGQNCDAGVEASDDAGLGPRPLTARYDMGDEVAGEVARRRRIGAGARIVVAVPVPAPAGDVEDPEAHDRKQRASRSSEGSERDHEDVDD